MFSLFNAEARRCARMADSQKYNHFQGDLKACVASYLGAAKTSGALILSSIASLVAAAPQRKRALP
jgi:hypothetical protein